MERESRVTAASSMERESRVTAANGGDETHSDSAAEVGRERDGAKAVLLVGKCVVRETGNATTLDRLGRAVRCGGWECVTLDPDSLPAGSSFSAFVTQHNIVAALGIHAYRSAPVLLACQELGVPYVLMFGGTDVNECAREAAKKDVMGRVVAGARSLLAFNASTRDTVLQIWPSLHTGRIWILPQAVHVNPDSDFDVLSYLEFVEAAYVAARTSREGHEARKSRTGDRNAELESAPSREKDTLDSAGTEGRGAKESGPCTENGLSQGPSASNTASEALMNGISRELPQNGLSETREPLPDIFQPLLLLVAGLRPVKDVLYLAEAWSGWQRARGGRGRFLILGPALDPQYSAYVHAQLDSLSGVRVCPTLPPAQCQALISSATVLVNSSRSESMSSAILEAMALGTPVLARNIYGNASVITHRHTGLLYDSPDAFLQELDGLLQDSALKKGLVTAAKDHVTRCHSLEQEKDLLVRILKQAMQ